AGWTVQRSVRLSLFSRVGSGTLRVNPLPWLPVSVEPVEPQGLGINSEGFTPEFYGCVGLAVDVAAGHGSVRVMKESRRAAVRNRTLRTGIIEFDSGTTSNIISVPCTIRDVSSTGVRLELNSSLWFPKQFTLIFNVGLRKDCRVAWRKGRVMG